MTNILVEITSLFQYGFFLRAFLAGTILAVVAPLIGQFMVVKRYSGLSDGVSHVALLGIGIGLILNAWPTFFGIVLSILVGLLIEWFRVKNILKPETSLILTIVGSLSLLSVLQQKIGLGRSIESLLFGSIYVVDTRSVWLILLISIVLISFVVLNYKNILNTVFDEDLATSMGINTNVVNFALVVLASVVVAISIDIIGGLLVSGLMIIPVASSFQYKLSFLKSHILSIFLSVVGLWLGLIASWFLDVPAGATISLVGLFIFVLSLILNYKNK